MCGRHRLVVRRRSARASCPFRSKSLTVEWLEDRTLPSGLTLTLTPHTISEAAGPGAATATITRSGDTTLPLTVNLASSNPAAATVAPLAFIPAGQTVTQVPVTPVDNSLLDGTRTATINGWAGGIGRDLAFGPGGPIAQDTPTAALMIQPDGKILTVGSYFINDPNNYYDFLVSRYNPDGTSDASFGSGGRVRTDVSGGADRATALVLQPDGKIVVGGYDHIGTNAGYLVVRYNPDGTLDSGFGSGGKVIDPTPPSTSHYHEILGLALQADSKIVASGTAYDEGSNATGTFAVYRFTASGSLDLSFGAGGEVSTDFSPYGDVAHAVVIQGDGKIVVAGGTSEGNEPGTFGLARYSSAGVLDPTFGNGGVVTTDLPGSWDEAHALILQPDGKLVAAGQTALTDVAPPLNFNFALARYNPDGSLDATFGSGGLVETELGGVDQAWGLLRQADGKLVAVGAGSPRDCAGLVRYNSDGSLDTADFGSNGSSAAAVALQPGTGQLVMAGSVNYGSGFVERYGSSAVVSASDTLSVTDDDVALTVSLGSHSIAENAGPGATVGTVTRLNANTSQPLTVQLSTSDPTEATVSTSVVIPAGQASATFAVNAVDDSVLDGSQSAVITAIAGQSLFNAATPFGGPSNYYVDEPAGTNGMAVQPDGKIVTAGTFYTGSGSYPFDFLVARYNSDGTPDTSFGGTGSVLTDVTGFTDQVSAVLLQPDGKIVVGGRSYNGSADGFILVRYNPDGSLDTGFGSGGKVTLNVGNGDLWALALQPDGKILAGGDLQTRPPYWDFAVVRYNANGSLDTSFGMNGVATALLANTGGQGSALVLQADGKILLAGSAAPGAGGSEFALARFNASGSLDSTYGSGGLVLSDISNTANEAIAGAALEPNGKLLVAGTGWSGSWTTAVLARYNADGSSDYGFGGSGTGWTTADYGGTGQARAVSVLVNGTILVAGSGGFDSQGLLTAYDPTGNLIPTNFTYPVNNWQATAVAFQPDGFKPDGLILAAGNAGGRGFILRYGGGDLAIGSDTLAVTDDEVNHLTVTLSRHTVSEGDGPAAATATVTRVDTEKSQALTVYLSSGNPARVTVPASVVIPAGQLSATVNVGVVDDALYEGTQDIPINAWVPALTPDAGYGAGGEVATGALAAALAVQADGKAVAALSGTSLIVARYNLDGAPDTGFGGSGIVTTDVPGEQFSAIAVTIQADGKLVVGGVGGNAAHGGMILARYNPDGSLDSGFGTAGLVFGPSSFDSAYVFLLRAVAVDPDGKILAAGALRDISGGAPYLAVLRYQGDGTLDDSFGYGGLTIVSGSYSSAQAYGMALLPDGSILLAGVTDEGNSTSQFALARLTTDGTADPAFGTNGLVTTDLPGDFEGAYAVALQPDGKIVAAGRVGPAGAFPPVYDVVLVRYNPDGSLDAGFGTGGEVITDFGGNDQAWGVVVQSDGRIVVAGTGGAGDAKAGLARYRSDGSLETGNFYSSNNFQANSIALQQDGQILLAGVSPSGTGFLERYAGNAVINAADTLTVNDNDTNTPPTAADDSYSATEGTLRTVAAPGVLANDHDPDPQTLTAVLVSAAAHGTLNLAGDGSFTYTPNANFVGTDQFTYQVSDGVALSNSATVTLTVANVAPVVTEANQTAQEGKAQSFGLGSFTDPGTDGPWAVDVHWGDGSADTTLSASAPGALAHHVHTYADNGTYTVTVTVTDRHGGAGVGTFLVAVSDLPPTAGISPPADGFQGVSGQTRAFTLTASDPSSVDQNAGFTYAVKWGDSSPLETFTGPSGTAASHVYARPGSYTIRVTATDKDGLTGPAATRTVTILTAEEQGGTLAVGGTPGNDQIVLSAGPNPGDLGVSVNGTSAGMFHPTVSVQVIAGAGSDGLTLNGSGGTDRFIVDPAAVIFNGLSINGTSVESWKVFAQAGDDSITLNAGAIATLNGGDGRDTLLGPGGTPLWQITATNAGKVAGTTFLAVENLLGGSGGDTFRFSSGASLGGFVDGGGGTNTLDYSLWTTGVAVDLNAGTATAVPGGIQQIQNVYGSSGNDLLAGNAANNLLRGNAGDDTLQGGGGNDILSGGDGNDTILGGPGRSILLGGKGADTMTGGGADDLLIGGTTSYDVQNTALSAILAEWKRTDLTYDQRISHLTGAMAGGKNGASVLTSATVHDDGVADALTGGAGMDWFWAQLSEVSDLQSGERVSG